MVGHPAVTDSGGQCTQHYVFLYEGQIKNWLVTTVLSETNEHSPSIYGTWARFLDYQKSFLLGNKALLSS